MVWPLIAAATALTAGGAYFANKSAKKAARRQMEYQTVSDQKQMAFQEQMSNTAYQRSVEDMRQAGINPILAFNAGGASTPSGTSSAGASYAPEDVLGGAVSSAMMAKRMQEEVANLREQNKQIRSQTHLNNALTDVADWEAAIKHSAAEISKASVPGAKIEAEIDQSKYGEVIRYLQRLSPLRWFTK